MKYLIFIAALMMSLPALADANSDAFNAGASYGKGNASQGTGSLSNPGAVTSTIPGYTTNPPQSSYYGGVTGGDSGLSSSGQTALGASEAGQAIISSGTTNPPPAIDPSAPYITIGKQAEGGAGSVLDGTGKQCTQTGISKSTFESYTCERDVWLEQSCSRTGTASGSMGAPVATTKTVTITNESFIGDGRTFRVTMPENMIVTSAKLLADKSLFGASGSFMNTGISLDGTSSYDLNFTGSVSAGQVFTSSEFCSNQCNAATKSLISQSFENQHIGFTLILNTVSYEQTFVPAVKWTESCAISKTGAVKTGSTCTAVGGSRPVTVDGNTYQVQSDCWQYTDTYLTKANSNGNCDALMKNTACTVNSTTCNQKTGSYCEHETLTYECQTVHSSVGLVCGGQYFCQSGECSDTDGAGDSGFDTAVAKLAGLASAADDVKSDTVNVKAFTGQVMSCRKSGAGFSNCCKDSGWGQDTGLASCNSNEMALGKAKAKKVTVSLGDRCDHSVLGVCIQKSKVYCVFGGMLARIIQEQGRRDQLHVSFGNGNSPNCRGITVPELQGINFDLINFADFYDDLMDNQKIPDSAVMVKQVKDRIAAQVNQQTGGK
nr:type-F conjugative transfer system mating-pair stabilization protein TraN [uncultured Enterobacter sp.]